MTSKAESSAPCVICRRPSTDAYRPFCSKRCADLDLQRWLTGGYVIPGSPDDEPDEGPAGHVEED
jgi:endogenous inhibitor of DNA gyrase (YacG/DUF329 family)